MELLKICLIFSIYLLIGDFIDRATRKEEDYIPSWLIVVTWPILLVLAIIVIVKEGTHD